MNIDFDSLRDPDAPIPGSRERAGVDARARRLRARARMNRLALSSVSVVAVVALAFGIVASQRDNGPKLSVEGNNTPASSIGDRFVPPTSIENGVVTLPVTLPDGARTTLTYPQDLRIAQLGFAGGIGVDWPADTGTLRCCGKQISIRYTTIADVYGDATPIKVYRGANGEEVPYFSASQQIPPQPNPLNYLVFQFGPWLVQVYDVQQAGDFERPMTDAQRATWARSITGTLDDNGYLLLHTEPPLSLAHDFDGLFGAPKTGANQLEIASNLYCGGPAADSSNHRRFTQGDGTPGVAWCDGGLHVSATGSAAFVGGVDRGLQTNGLSAPNTTPSTTTATTTPVTPASPAVSASFVSPDHGWVLQGNGTVAETTDGGGKWQPVGRFPIATNFVRMRFADSLHGYALVEDNAQRNSLFATTDGGAHWQELATPFGPVFDFAVSRGALYAVAMQPSDSNFRIWSSTVADALHWTEDPLVVPVGAGPVPSIQLVLSGDRGWVVEVDRTVSGAAQLSASGRWSTWSPLCADKLGPADLAASSATELVVTCQEHVWGGGPITSAIYFSHDAGATATRHDAPAFGPVATPNSTTAVVMGGPGLERTTDGGATWRLQYSDEAQFGPANPDVGFTTSTQGFAIFRDGTMLMTYDAGATWQKVTLP